MWWRGGHKPLRLGEIWKLCSNLNSFFPRCVHPKFPGRSWKVSRRKCGAPLKPWKNGPLHPQARAVISPGSQIRQPLLIGHQTGSVAIGITPAFSRAHLCPHRQSSNHQLRACRHQRRTGMAIEENHVVAWYANVCCHREDMGIQKSPASQGKSMLNHKYATFSDFDSPKSIYLMAP